MQMSRDAKLASPSDTLQRAAQLMKECDCGVLPVANGDRPVGMIPTATRRSGRSPMARARLQGPGLHDRGDQVLRRG